MIHLETKDRRFVLEYNGLKIIVHTPESPFLYAGCGKGSFTMYHGNFDIQENLEEKLALADYRVLEKNTDAFKIEFSKKGLYALVVHFKEVNGRLEASFEDASGDINRVWIRLHADKKEHIYGCGEQFSELDLRGKKVPLWVEEQGVGRNKKDYMTFQADVFHNAGGDWYTTYFPQPTFVSTQRYFCHVEDSHYMVFDFRAESYHELSVWALPKKIVISRRENTAAVLKDLTAYLGRQPALPDWTYDGVWLGLQGGTETVLRKLQNAEEHGLKVAALWVQDWQGKRVTAFGKQLMWDWKYSEEMYPGLPETIKELSKKGIRFLGYINPFLALEGELYQEASAKGYLVRQKTGEEYHVVITTFPAAMLDLTNPAAIAWIKDVIKENMMGIGLAGWMSDYGEYLPTDAVLYSGESAEAFHNKLPVVWAKTNREAVEEAGQLGEVVFFSRAGYTGMSRYSTIMWAGDQLVNWSLDDGLASVIPAALSLGMSGFGISHSDIGGFTTILDVKRTKELFMRWAELSAFTPIMRTHEGNRPDDNWQFDSDEETLLHFARLSRIYSHLRPYLKKAVQENAEKGLPVMRHPYIHYENDEVVHTLKYQYLLGRDLMVAPVYQEAQNSQKVYLPDDQWIHLWSGQAYGKGWCEVSAPLGHIPVFYRQQSQYGDLFKQIPQL
ncbi:MAG: alpha-glucosidase [Firmicutes bacterium]|nr:alpha-glucosidase [Bacillota bacterium]